jgi:hypothetical protein
VLGLGRKLRCAASCRFQVHDVGQVVAFSIGHLTFTPSCGLVRSCSVRRGPCSNTPFKIDHVAPDGLAASTCFRIF